MSGFHPTAIYETNDPDTGVTPTQNPPPADTGVSDPLGEHTPDLPSTDTTSTTTSTSTTSSTTSTTTSTTSTPPPPPPPTTSSTTTQAPPTQGTDTVEVTITPTLSSASSSAPLPSTSSINDTTDDTTSSKGLIVGGIVAAVVAISVIVFAVWWFKRRKRRHDAEAGGFDASDFRRSAMMLNDPPTHEDVVANGYGSPRPPSMFQHRMASPAPTFGTQYGAAPPVPAMSYGQDINSPVSYGGAQTYASPSPYAPYTPDTSAAFLSNGAYTASPYSPAVSEYTTDPRYNLYDEKAHEHDLSRQPSTGSINQQAHYPPDLYPQAQEQQEQSQQYNHGPTLSPANHSDHVDLNRSSVSPYQAAQYAEISRQLNTEVPQGLTTPGVERYLQETSGGSMPPLPAKESEDVKALPSPFEDPIDAHATDAHPAPLNNHEEAASHRDSDLSPGSAMHLHDFPEPPPNGAAHHWRVDSTPPILPEINVEGGRDSYGFPAPPKSQLAGQDFPVTPSPMKSTFSHEQESSVGHGAVTAGAVVPVAVAPKVVAKAEKIKDGEITQASKRPDTVYDPEDVYGGI